MHSYAKLSTLPFKLSLSLSAAFAFVACGGTTSNGATAAQDAAVEASTPADGATTDGASPDGTSPGSDAGGTAILIPDDATLTFRSEGGFAANGTDTSICTLINETYRLVVATGAFTWKRCAIADGGATNDYVTGSRTLATADAAPLRAALAAVRRVPASTGVCGADKPAETLEIASPNALTPEVLHDTFDRCTDSSIEHASGLDEVFSELAKLAH
jgi:hypothetical protein